MKNTLQKIVRVGLVSLVGLSMVVMHGSKVHAAAFPTYPRHDDIMATMFYVGEGAAAENGFISNHASAWDEHWVDHFGGVDTPYDRRGWYPADFTPKENPFYVALPYNDRDDVGGQKASALQIPWHHGRDKSILKNFWVEVCHRERCAYGQWEDVGPGEVDDVNYVFGNDLPSNIFGQEAGIDLSPALNDYLHMDDDNGLVSWRLMYPDTVPEGPWWNVPTTRW